MTERIGLADHGNPWGRTAAWAKAALRDERLCAYSVADGHWRLACAHEHSSRLCWVEALVSIMRWVRALPPVDCRSEELCYHGVPGYTCGWCST